MTHAMLMRYALVAYQMSVASLLSLFPFLADEFWAPGQMFDDTLIVLLSVAKNTPQDPLLVSDSHS